MDKKYKKIYKRIYDGKEDGFSDNTHPNELLGEFEIVYGEFDYAFSLIGINKEDNKPYNIIGDEVSGYYNPEMGGTKIRIVPIILQEERWV